MVFPGEEEELEEDYTATGPKKKTLHNFSFTDLKWGAHRNLRCTKIESNGVDQRLRRRSSPPKFDNRSRENGIEEVKESILRDYEEEKRNKKEREVSPPWNLRKRRAACKAPINDSDGNQWKEKGFGEENGVRPKFVSTLLKKEVEDDYMVMMGHRPPRRPKKRPRNVQKQIDSLYPAFYFGEVTEDIYDVPDADGNGKK
ncbi:hypothetical protein N665_1404s0007 [Sinapis alba]|nr:hypothetical protein N665_1404s0007 [Sinapis alba]